MQALLGTRLSADINLVAQLLILIGLWIGLYFARTKRIRQHGNTQTAMVLVNLFFIALIMATSFYKYVIAGGTTTGTVARLMMVHGALGLVAEGTGIYLILRMRTQLIPPRLRVGNYKLVMRSTLALWTVLLALGVATYYYRYLSPESVAAEPVPLVHLRQAGQDLLIHALEMEEAAARNNLGTVKRHAEHVVNLLEGKAGQHYGDLDRDGVLEDPGDGTGLLTYLDSVAGATKDEEFQSVASKIRRLAEKLRRSALFALETSDLNIAATFSKEAVSLSREVNTEGLALLEAKAKQKGVSLSPFPSASVPGVSGEANTVTIFLDQFRFKEATVTISPGSRVVWVSKDVAKHTVTSDDRTTFHSGDMGQGSQFSRTFDEVGTFPYYCRFHVDKGGVDMAGRVIVQP